MLRSDNGSEYTSSQFEGFLQQSGIFHQKSVVYTPQQNGVCERKNRIIMDMSRCLLFEKKLPKLFWAEAANTAVYLLNRSATKSLDSKTPFEAWHEVKPDVSNLKVFGCVCYTLVPEPKRSKLDERSKLAIFIGYNNHSKGYRVFNLESQKVEVCRSVKFDESALWDWSKKEVASSPNSGAACDYYDIADQEDNLDEESYDHEPVRGSRPLQDVYDRCNTAMNEPVCTADALQQEN